MPMGPGDRGGRGKPALAGGGLFPSTSKNHDALKKGKEEVYKWDNTGSLVEGVESKMPMKVVTEVLNPNLICRVIYEHMKLSLRVFGVGW
jgi:hypothetical protein